MDKGRRVFFGKRRRTYIGNSLAKIVEFIVSLSVIGYIIAGKIDPKIHLDLKYVVVAGIIASVLLIIGVVITPEDDS